MNALSNLGTLREFIIGNYFKTIQSELAEKTKKTFMTGLTNL